MASLDQLKGTFFDECSEALQQIELGLSDLREGAASDDTINAVFRSVHSVKGGAGIFGFDDLVKFAHVLETVLDAMRSGKLASSQDIVNTLLQANDVLSDLIGMSRSGETIPAEYGSECRAGLERILQTNHWGMKDGAIVVRRPRPISKVSISFRFRSKRSLQRTRSRPNRNTALCFGPRPIC
jgi:two-component system, chemotaxis family, sensor kinase CheA